MTTSDQISYGRAARLRAAVAGLAAEISDSAAGMVPTYADGYAHRGELAEQAHRLAADVRELERLTVAYERVTGASWEVLAEGLGLNSRQAAHDRYSDAVKQLEDAITECWLRGDDPRTTGLPAGACDTAETARLLDRWVLRHMEAETTHPLYYKAADDPDRTHPASAGLEPMTAVQHSSLVLAGVELISRRRSNGGLDDPEVRELERSLARRKIELYERMLADDSAGKHTGPPASELREILAGARARLAELTGADTAAEG
jgi:hypothetical protein